MKPFHLSFVVKNKQESKRFYTNVLGCKTPRDTGAWFDVIFTAVK